MIAARADDWRDTDEERGFAMALSRIGDPADGDCLLVEAVMDEGTTGERVVGMLSFVPWGRRGVSLDLMRRDRHGPNGVVETMVALVLARAALAKFGGDSLAETKANIESYLRAVAEREPAQAG